MATHESRVPTAEQGQLLCSKCNLLKIRADFGPVIKRTGKPHSWCKKCQAAARRVAYRANPKKESEAIYRSRLKKAFELNKRVNAMKASTPCADCHQLFDSIVMDFDHREPGMKYDSVSRMINRALSWERIEAEIAKCDVVCSNCHRLRTRSLWAKRRFQKWNKLREELAS